MSRCMVFGCKEAGVELLTVTRGAKPSPSILLNVPLKTFDLDEPIVGWLCEEHHRLLPQQHPTLGGLPIDGARLTQPSPGAADNS